VFSCYSLVVYAGRFVLPARLLYIYPFPMTPGGEMPLHYFIYPVIVIAAMAAKNGSRQEKMDACRGYVLAAVSVRLCAYSYTCLEGQRYGEKRALGTDSWRFAGG
jgi:hypothetical protein